MNVLKPHLRTTIETLLAAGTSQHEIARRTGVDRKTIRSYAGANSLGVATGAADTADIQNLPPRPPAPAASNARQPSAGSASACEPHRAWIETQLDLGRNAQSLYQDLVDRHGFTHRYNSVKRFVALRARPRDEWLALLAARGIPCAPLHTLGELDQHPHTAASDMILAYQHRDGRDLKGVAMPLRVDGQRPALRSVPPALGEHSRAILRELGFEDALIAQWLAQGIVVDGS